MKTCCFIVGYTKDKKPIFCTNKVRFEKSFVCTKHVWVPEIRGKTKLPVKEMQERILAMRRIGIQGKINL